MWSRETFSAVQILTRNIKITSAIKLKFGGNRFGKRTMYNLQTRIQFQKKSSSSSNDQVDKIIDQLHLSKCIPNTNF